MTPMLFYCYQAEQRWRAANKVALENVKERCRRASDAWAAFSKRSERNEVARAQGGATNSPDLAS